MSLSVTEPKNGKVRAVGMLSGGLDSTLATKIMLDQGIDVLGLNFYTGFCVTEQQRRVGRQKAGNKPPRNEALRAGADLEVPIEIMDIAEDYREVVLHPKHGYGANMNPCVDCRAFMLGKAREYMIEVGAQFVFTGEVLGQRPKSQHRAQLGIVAREAGLEGYLLRPLSAKLLDPTIPEQKGWVNRDLLESIHGRSREGQMQLAEKFGVTDYPPPAGGCCYLADPNYARKFRDLLGHRETRDYSPDDAILLGLGRHFRLSPVVKVVVGRDKNENEVLARMKDGRIALAIEGVPGPFSLVEGPATAVEIELASRLAARYADRDGDRPVAVAYSGAVSSGTLEVLALSDEEVQKLRV